MISIILGVKMLYIGKLKHVTVSDIVSNNTGVKFLVNFYLVQRIKGGTRWRSWLRHCATSR